MEIKTFLSYHSFLYYSYIRNMDSHSNAMKHSYCFLILFFVFCSLKANTDVSRDSLLHIVTTTNDPYQQYMAYINLADLHFEKPEQCSYLLSAYQTIRKTEDKKAVRDVLAELVLYYMHIEEDSANYYMNRLESEVPSDENTYIPYLRMKIFDRKVLRSKEESEAVMKKEFELFKQADKNNICIRIEQAYVTGSSLYENGKYKESIPYFETAYSSAKTLRSEERYKYIPISGWEYATALSRIGNYTQSIELIEEILQQYQEGYHKYYEKQRPFYPIYLYLLQYYTKLIDYIEILPAHKAEYYINEIKRIAPKVTAMFDKYNCCSSMSKYLAYKRDYKRALSYNDSMIAYIKILAPVRLPKLLETRSKYYEKLNDLPNALKTYKLYAETKDSISYQQTTEQLNKLQIQYDIDKLTYEKTTLENKNRYIILNIQAFALFFVCVACFYLSYNLRKERRMKKRLHELNEKAEESEKLKTAFLSSMCHEIRTPLNAIVGFSGVIIDESIDHESKQEFYEQITDNSNKLISLVEHLLIVANLDSSEEKFPCEPIDITAICRDEIAKAQREGKSSIAYTLDLPNDEVIVITNGDYLSLVIENLLNNANKFTQQGEIKLTIQINHDGIEISITDTGHGIPLEKQEEVFNRFTKLDAFSQGNGLGLYICRIVAKRLSGSIKIDSDYTQGSRFVLSLPQYIVGSTNPKLPSNPNV